MAHDDALAKRNALVLSGAQALAGANASVVFATGALVGASLGPSPAWATAPTTTFVLGTALATMPAAYLLRTLGRRAAYQYGAAMGVLAGLLAAYAVREGSFALFMLATALCGCYQAFVVNYRFGATDNASPVFRPKAIAWVLAGGIAAAFVGPQLVIHTKDMLAPYTFMASYIGQAAVAGLSISLLFFFRNAPAPAPGSQEPARPLREILKSRRLKLAIGISAIAQALMNFIMTATPLAMIGCFHTTTDATLAIQWHIVGMFLPGFFTGPLIARFGVYKVIAAGLILLALCGIVGLSGITIAHFNTALVLLGIGWNFAFVGASAVVAEGQKPAERNLVQGFTDLVIFSVTALASLSSGKLLAGFGWTSLNIALFPFVAAALVMVFLLLRDSRKPATA
ncbi:MAG: MFS transporter [Beijerinckiaceae bacterium]|jgi:MFS family permease|nr:MFS transporter [Beijerinckiaceae bacterium]